MLKLSRVATIIATVFVCASANATVINFDNLVGPGQYGPSSGSGFVDSGFVFSNNMDAIDLTRWCYGSCAGHSGNYGALNNYYGNMVMTKQGGGTFSVQNLWLRDWFGDSGNATVVGLLSGGVVGSVNASLTSNWSDIVLNFGNVDTLRVDSQYVFTIDDIQVNGSNNVPEPGSLALLGLGLAGLSAFRRKKAS